MDCEGLSGKPPPVACAHAWVEARKIDEQRSDATTIFEPKTFEHNTGAQTFAAETTRARNLRAQKAKIRNDWLSIWLIDLFGCGSLLSGVPWLARSAKRICSLINVQAVISWSRLTRQHNLRTSRQPADGKGHQASVCVTLASRNSLEFAQETSPT